MIRRRALGALSMLAVVGPLAGLLTACGSGNGQLTVGVSGDYNGSAYNAADPKTFPDYKPGDQATFTVTVVNSGPGSVSGVTVHVVLPESFRYHATTQLTAQGATRTQPLDAAVNSTVPIFGLWTLGSPGSGGASGNTSVAITFTADVGGQPGPVMVQAFAAGDTTTGDTNTATYNVVVDAAAKVTALVSVAPTHAHRGDTITYQVRIINSGTGNAKNVGVLVTLPPVMVFASSVTPFAGNGTRSMGVDPLKNTLDVFYDGFTLPPLSNGAPGYVVIVFKATVLGSFTPPTSEGFNATPAPSSAPSTVPSGTYTVDANLTDSAGDTFSLHAVAPVTIS